MRRINAIWQGGYDGSRGRRGLIALAHHDPPAILQNNLARLIAPGRADINRSSLLIRILFEPDNFRHRRQRVARIDRFHEAAIGVAEIGNRVERDVRRRLAEDNVEHQHVVERRARITQRLGKHIRRLHRKTRAIKRGVKRDVADCHGLGRGMFDDLAETKVLEEISNVRFRTRHRGSPCPA